MTKRVIMALVVIGAMVTAIASGYGVRLWVHSEANQANTVVADQSLVVPDTTTSTTHIAAPPSPALVKIAEKLTSKAEPKIIPIQERKATAPIATTVTPVATEVKIVAPTLRTIATKAIIGLLCYADDGSQWKGSGVIVHPRGYILTNRHVAEGSEYCEVAMPGDNIILPTAADIKEYNPFSDISNSRPYQAVIEFLPSIEGLSEKEIEELDFAVMKITGPNKGCEKFLSGCNMPAAFPYNPISLYKLEPYQQIISYGYPAEENAAYMEIFKLKGSIGYLVEYTKGDKKFINNDLKITRKTDWGTFSGSSGSGVFFNGYVVGIHYAGLTKNSTIGYEVPTSIIYDVLKDAQRETILTFQ